MMGKFTGKPNQFDGKNHGFRLRFSPTNQSSDHRFRLGPWLNHGYVSHNQKVHPGGTLQEQNLAASQLLTSGAWIGWAAAGFVCKNDRKTPAGFFPWADTIEIPKYHRNII